MDYTSPKGRKSMERKYDIEKILKEIGNRKISIGQYAKENGIAYNNLMSAISYARKQKQKESSKLKEQLCITEVSDDSVAIASYNFSIYFDDNKKVIIQASSIKDIEAILKAAKNV